MAELKLSKQALTQQQEQLKLYHRLLPSLDLKRRQLSIEVKKAEAEHAAIHQELEALQRHIGEELPMLAHPDFKLQALVTLAGFEVGEQNIVGVRLPVLERLECRVADYSRLATPPWVDVLVERLKQAVELQLKLDIAARRLDILRRQVRKVTQRVNLFEKILIPTAKENIKRIRLYLDEADRSAVIISKLAKRKQLARRETL
ncbi:V/A-type H+/Na+-transporting ATPase subunit D [Methylomarinovum tepidoasis]|uniref:V/A-type H+/Na+-transporting ATPase subunit D n=1 Tax=Methylomarinovum tepidoasis TaxID=2840183 RepID=A0AAU9BXX4_9GAMM|nr:V-type ATP synthase subunit D [Methylomarinovum sp. IN45]BCX88565.1 V/A-type H+/Na+-transporting ATPase subunit D [Methylomarinovum sp. IN45]